MKLKVTQARLAKGWSKAELSRRAGLNQGTVYEIETGRFIPYPSQLKKLANALDFDESQAALLLEEADD